MNIRSKICVTVLIISVLILIVLNASAKMNLKKQIAATDLLRNEIESSMLTKGELVDYAMDISEVIKEYQLNKASILDSLSGFKLPILIYGYPEKECGMCVNKDLKQLYDFQNLIGKEHVCVLSSFSENRNNHTRLKNELTSFDYKNISKMSEIKHRYYALINAGGCIEMIFIPQLDMPDLSAAYFDTVKNKFNVK